MEAVLKLGKWRLPDRAVNGFGSQFPIFVGALPAGFTQRLGRTPADFLYSGTFQSAGFRIGYIRIPSFNPPNATTSATAFRSEIAFFEQNTDGLIVDVMRKPGGSVAFTNQILALLCPTRWQRIAVD